MNRYPGLIGLGFILLFSSCAHQELQKPVLLEKANVLPLQLNDSYQFRKMQLFLNQPNKYGYTTSEAMQYERQRVNWGAVTTYDLDQVSGNFFIFHWRATVRSDVTLRLEFRQAALGNFVQAEELYYPGFKGSQRSQFRVTGDDYLENGRVTSWRALLIVDGKIVALTQSYMWR